MKKILFGLLSFVAIVSLSSCDYKNEIRKLIKAHEYDEARELAYAHFSEYNNLDVYLRRIDIAQLEELYSDKAYNEIKSVKKDIKSAFAYQYMFAKNFKNILGRSNYDFIFETFEDWKIFGKFKKELDQWPHNEVYMSEEDEDVYFDNEDDSDVAEDRRLWDSTFNDKYNAEVKFLNRMIDETVYQLIEEKDIDNLRKFIKLYKPSAVLKSKSKLPSNNYSKDDGDYEHHYIFELVSSAQEEAVKRISAAGIHL